MKSNATAEPAVRNAVHNNYCSYSYFNASTQVKQARHPPPKIERSTLRQLRAIALSNMGIVSTFVLVNKSTTTTKGGGSGFLVPSAKLLVHVGVDGNNRCGCFVIRSHWDHGGLTARKVEIPS